MKRLVVILFLTFFFVTVANAENKTLDYLGGRYENRLEWEILEQNERFIIFMDKAQIKFLQDIEGNVNEQIILTTEEYYYIDGVMKKQVQNELAQKGYYIDYLALGYEVKKMFYNLKRDEVIVVWRTIYDKDRKKVYETKFPGDDTYATYLNELEQMLQIRKIKKYLAENYAQISLNTNS